jgi:hypothetical protein
MVTPLADPCGHPVRNRLRRRLPHDCICAANRTRPLATDVVKLDGFESKAWEYLFPSTRFTGLLDLASLDRQTATSGI